MTLIRSKRWKKTILAASIAVLAAAPGISLAATPAKALATADAIPALPAVNSEAAINATKPLVFPTPREINPGSSTVSLKGRVNIVAPSTVDAPALAAIKALVTQQGGTPNVVTPTTTVSTGETAIYLGTSAQNPAVAREVTNTGMNYNAIKPEGYLLKVYGKKIVASGIDDAGTYYAVQSLKQLTNSGAAREVTIKDWPGMSIRGSIEGFYGTPWSHQARLDQFPFYASVKLNTYIYSPKDDPYLRGQWRSLYPAAELAQLKELVDAATAHHVNFTYAVSPGLNMCYSSASDYDALAAKLQQAWSVGVRTFNIPFDDISIGGWHCDSDASTFGAAGDAGAAAAQSAVLNRLNREFIKTHPGAKPLEMVPTDYSGVHQSTYRDGLISKLDSDVLVQWTGMSVWSASISKDQAQGARDSYGHKILIWDNYPTNDCCGNQIFLAPLSGRSTDQDGVVEGYTSNPLNQSYVSQRTLIDFALYTWNNPAYDQNVSLGWALNAMSGGVPKVRQSLGDFVDSNWASRINGTSAPLLSNDVARYWAGEYKDPTTSALWLRLTRMSTLVDDLKSMPYQGFYQEAMPWLLAAQNQSRASLAALKYLNAQQCNNTALATAAKADYDQYHAAANVAAITLSNGVKTIPIAGNGQHEALQARALTGFPEAKPTTNLSTWNGNDISRIADGDDATLFWSGGSPTTGSYVQRDLGAISNLSNVTLNQGQNDADSAGDILLNGNLEVSTDGTTWRVVGAISGTVTNLNLAQPTAARYVRAKATASQTNWWKVRELAVTTSKAATSSLNAYWIYTSDKVNDGNLGSFFWSYGQPVAGSHVTTSLGTLRTVSNVTLKQGQSDTDTNGDVLLQGKMQVSADGVMWRDIGAINGTTTSINLSPAVPVLYVRALATATQHNWWKVREITATNAPLQTTSDGTKCLSQ